MLSRLTVGVALVLTIGLLSTFHVLAHSAASPGQAQLTGQNELRLNEFMADNKQTLEDPDEPGEYPDWVEIYNPTNEAVSLDGLSLSDNSSRPDKFPITNGLTIPAGGFIVFIADDDPSQGPLHTNFRLDATGEFIGLFVAEGGAMIDSREFGALPPDVSQGRKPDGSGAWVDLSEATPGASNAFDPPIIRNVRHVPQQPQANQAVSVTATITDVGAGAVTGVTLFYSATGTSQIAMEMTKSGDFTYTAQVPGQGDGALVTYFIEARDDQNEISRTRLRGYLIGYQPPQLVINEVMAENAGFREDPDDAGEFPDWLELYNPGPQTVNLAGLSLSDNESRPLKHQIVGDIAIPAGGYLVFYLDDDPEQGATHTNFSLNKNGEFIGLYGGMGTVLIDGLEFGQQFDNFSLGRYPDGAEWMLLVCATPGQPNILCDKSAFLPIVTNK
jgi:hypothetical protein